MPALNSLARWVRTQPILHKTAHSAVRLLPNIRYTKRFPGFGPLCFRLRQNRWFLWAEFLAGEETVLGMFERIVRPGDVMYDIGANIGTYTRAVHHWYGAEHVIAFEPMTDNVDLLNRNIRLGNMVDHAQVFDVAIGDQDGEEDLQIDDITSGTAVLDSVSEGKASAGRQELNLKPRTERVRVVRLDNFIREHSLRPPDSIKIDVEGAECIVLDGAAEVLCEHQPRLLIATHGEDKASGCITRLKELGYHCFGFVREGDDRSIWTEFTEDDAARLGNSNFIASCDPADGAAPVEPRKPGPR